MPNRPLSALTSATLSLALVVGAASSAIADTNHARAALGYDLDVLVQQAAASVCMINAGVDVRAEMIALGQSRMAFIATLDQLSDAMGDHALAQISVDWAPLDVATSMILVGDHPNTYKSTVMQGLPPLQAAIQKFLSQSAQTDALSDDKTVSDMLTMDVAARQALFVQQIKLQACELGSGTATASLVRDFTATTTSYDVTLTALRDGQPDVGINAPHSYQVSQMLAAAMYDWQRVKPMLDVIAANGTATPEQLTKLRGLTDALQVRTSALVDQYFLYGPDEAPMPQVALLLDGAE
ncbi:hypothetical protein [Yoonia sp.]|uniref:hypothetical protein n=1 Tax=Yoonia sp. TaxID=2212373 RepID=UPI0025F1D92C|nr:hypothetical protein [Yoonia sp.]